VLSSGLARVAVRGGSGWPATRSHSGRRGHRGDRMACSAGPGATAMEAQEGKPW